MLIQAVLVMACSGMIAITELRWNKLETKTLLFPGGFVQVSRAEIMCTQKMSSSTVSLAML